MKDMLFFIMFIIPLGFCIAAAGLAPFCFWHRIPPVPLIDLLFASLVFFAEKYLRVSKRGGGVKRV